MALIKWILIFLLSLVFIIIFFSVTTSLYANDIKKFKIEEMSLVNLEIRTIFSKLYIVSLNNLPSKQPRGILRVKY